MSGQTHTQTSPEQTIIYYGSPKPLSNGGVFDQLNNLDAEAHVKNPLLCSPSLNSNFKMPSPQISFNVHDQPDFQMASTLSDFDIDGNNEENDDEMNDNREEGTQNSYTRLIIENDGLFKGDAFGTEYRRAAGVVLKLLNIRDNYKSPRSEYSWLSELVEMQPPSSEPMINYAKMNTVLPKLDNVELKNIDGVYIPFIDGEKSCTILPVKEYATDIAFLMNETCNRAVKSFCYRRLCLLSEKFNMHQLFNREKEFYEQKLNIHRDFYNIRKVDNLIDHAAAMNTKTFLNFVKEKITKEADTEVLQDPITGDILTLEKVFEKYDLKARVFTIEDLEIKNYLETFRRYERNMKITEPSRQTIIGNIFLKRHNHNGGRYVAELMHSLFKEYEEYKFQFSELRLSLYGKSRDGWERMAEWFDTHKIYNHHVRWLVQIPRLYDILKKEKLINNFQDILDNIFQPLFEVTINPESNPKLHKLLLTVVGFDTIDNESGYVHASGLGILKTLPSQWTSNENPHFIYWAYYLWANLYALNSLRKRRGLNTFAFRPHVSESGGIEQLASAYLVSNGISRAVLLKKSPLLQYLFYLKQIGITMSPLSDNKLLYLKYKDNPFPDFFARGLNVSISTDHPLLYHMTAQPLIEEYSIAAQVFDLNSCDLCELARNSVIQCGFEYVLKSYWIGKNYKSLTPEGNDEEKTNVPRARYLYRIETLSNELRDLKVIAKD